MKIKPKSPRERQKEWREYLLSLSPEERRRVRIRARQKRQIYGQFSDDDLIIL